MLFYVVWDETVQSVLEQPAYKGANSSLFTEQFSLGFIARVQV